MTRGDRVMTRRTADDLRRWVPSHLPTPGHAEKLITSDLPAAVEEFLSRLPNLTARRRRRHRLTTTVALLTALAVVGVVVAVVIRVATCPPDVPDSDDDSAT